MTLFIKSLNNQLHSQVYDVQRSAASERVREQKNYSLVIRLVLLTLAKEGSHQNGSASQVQWNHVLARPSQAPPIQVPFITANTKGMWQLLQLICQIFNMDPCRWQKVTCKIVGKTGMSPGLLCVQTHGGPILADNQPYTKAPLDQMKACVGLVANYLTQQTWVPYPPDQANLPPHQPFSEATVHPVVCSHPL